MVLLWKGEPGLLTVAVRVLLTACWPEQTNSTTPNKTNILTPKAWWGSRIERGCQSTLYRSHSETLTSVSNLPWQPERRGWGVFMQVLQCQLQLCFGAGWRDCSLHPDSYSSLMSQHTQNSVGLFITSSSAGICFLCTSGFTLYSLLLVLKNVGVVQ